jgi:hypothetical protein
MALPAGLSSCAMCVEIMAGGTTWTDYSDFLSVVDPPAQTRMMGEAYVFGEDTAVLGAGKLEPTEVTIRGVWTDATADPFYAVLTEFQTACGDMVAVRWSPGGCASTHRSFRTSTTASEVSSLTFPGGDSGSADVLMWEAVIRSPDITEGAWA